MSTPRTDNTLEKLLDRRGTIGRHNCPEELVVLSRQLERELADANARIRGLEDVQEAGLTLMNAVAPFSLDPDEEGDDETTIRQCQPHAVIGWEEPPTAKEHIKLHDATMGFRESGD